MSFNRTYTSKHPVDDFSLPFSNMNFSATLTASTDTSFTVPGNFPRYKILIKAVSTAPVILWVALNGTAAAPAGSSFASTTGELINGDFTLCREVKSGDVVHFFTSATGLQVSISLYTMDITDHS